MPKRSQSEMKRGKEKCSGRKFKQQAKKFRAPQTEGLGPPVFCGASETAAPYKLKPTFVELRRGELCSPAFILVFWQQN